MRSALKSSSANPGVFSSALNSVFTPLMKLKRQERSSLTNAGKSRGLAISTLCAPNLTNTSKFPVSAKM